MTFLAWIASVIICTPLVGWTIKVLWGWFMVPIFAVPQLAISQALGLYMVVSFMAHHVDLRVKDTRSMSDVVGSGFVFILTKCGVALLTGRILKEFLP